MQLYSVMRGQHHVGWSHKLDAPASESDCNKLTRERVELNCQAIGAKVTLSNDAAAPATTP